MTSIRNLVPESQAGYDFGTVVTVPGDAHESEIPDELLQALKMNVVTRQVAAGFALLDSHRQLLESLDPLERNAASFAGYVAQWIDIGYSEPELLEKLLARFPSQVRGQLPLAGYLHLRMAEGLLALLRDHTEVALRHFDFVLSLRDEIQDLELLAIAHFWNARCHRRKGEYDEALKQCSRGYELAQTAGWPRMAAVMQVLEAWLMFQKGNRRAASQILDKAEAVLRHTDDDITLGNIYSAHGRMIRRQGSYKDSLRFFSKAIDHFRKRNPQHRNLARSLANIAYVQRLIAREISKEIDAEAERRRKSQAKGKPAATRGRKEDHWAEYEQVRATAFADLEQAEKIYRHHNHHHGIGNVKENRGLLYLDIGDLDNAADQAAQAYQLGKEENDSILMARARLLQCEVENARLEEEIEGSSHSWEHAQAARDYAREAVEAAKHTQYQRLLARAYIWRGLTACHPAINDREDARHCCERAESFLKSVQYDDLWQELQDLKQKVLPRGSIDPRLRAWSAGETDGKTFQELAEQFAEVVIPRVWEKEGKKVSRVANKLSVSPKKVRRILARAGKTKKKKS